MTGLLLAWACAVALLPVLCSCGLAIFVLGPLAHRMDVDRGLLWATLRLRFLAIAGTVALVASVVAGTIGTPAGSLVMETPVAVTGYLTALLSFLLLVIVVCIRVPSGRVVPALDDDDARSEASLPPPPIPARWPWRLGFIVSLSVIGPLVAMEQARFQPLTATPLLVLALDTLFRCILILWLGAILLRCMLSHRRTPGWAMIRRRVFRLQRRLVPVLTVSGLAMLIANASSAAARGAALWGASLLIGTALIFLGIGVWRRVSRRRVTLRSEAILGVGIFLLTIFLSSLAPSQYRLDPGQRAALREVAMVPPLVADLASGPQVAVVGTATDAIGALTLTTGRDGSTFFLHLSDAPGVPLDPRLLTGDTLGNLRVRPMAGVEQVHLVVSPVGAAGERIAIPLRMEPDGNYHAASRFLPTRRPWTLTLIVKRVGNERPTRLAFISQAVAPGTPLSLDALPSRAARPLHDTLAVVVHNLALAAIGALLGVLIQIGTHTPAARKWRARDCYTKRSP